MIDNPFVFIMLVVELALVIGLPVAAATIWRRRSRALWSSLAFGAITFVLAQFIRLALLQGLALLLNPLALSWDPALLTWFNNALLVLTSGLFEEGARWLIISRLARNVRTWREGVMFGIGHGGIEALLFVGGSVISALVLTLSAPGILAQLEQLPPEQAAAVRTQLDAFNALRWWEPLLGAWERVPAIVFHVGATLLVLLGLLRRDRRPLLAAMLLHIGFNAIAVVMLHFTGILLTELAITLAALLPLWLVFRLRKPLAAAAPTA